MLFSLRGYVSRRVRRVRLRIAKGGGRAVAEHAPAVAERAPVPPRRYLESPQLSHCPECSLLLCVTAEAPTWEYNGKGRAANNGKGGNTVVDRPSSRLLNGNGENDPMYVRLLNGKGETTHDGSRGPGCTACEGYFVLAPRCLSACDGSVPPVLLLDLEYLCEKKRTYNHIPTYMHTCIHTCIYTHAYIHTDTHTYIHTC